jgi:DNA-binding CsgD family transcriptional regulator
VSEVSEERLLGLVGRIYDAALEPQGWQGIVDELAGVYSGTAALTTQDAQGAEPNISAASGIDPDFARSYELHYAGTRPWLARVGKMAAGEIFTPYTQLDERDYERSEYYTDWMRPQKIYYISNCALAGSASGTTFLTLSRSYENGEFSAAELGLVGKLAPHLQRALELHRRLFAATQQRDLLTRGLEGLGVGAIIVDLDGRIGFANRTAEEFLKRGDGLVARHQRIQTLAQSATKALRHLIRGAARAGAGLEQADGGVLAIPRAQGGHLHVLVCPYPIEKAGWVGRLLPSAVIFVSETPCDVTLRPGDLEKLYGLTRAEAALMSALASGKSLDEYAAAAGLSRATTKTQLQHVFMKTDWHRQSEIVRGALTNGIARIAASRN